MNNIQEYFSPVGSSNSLYFVPNQIDTNEYLGCDTFYIVGLVEPVINQYSLFGKGKKVNENFIYSSETNKEWITVKELSSWIKKNQKNFLNSK